MGEKQLRHALTSTDQKIQWAELYLSPKHVRLLKLFDRERQRRNQQPQRRVICRQRTFTRRREN